MKKLWYALLLCLLLCVGCLFAAAQTTPPCAPGTHVFGAWTTVSAGTCTQKGRQERVCSVCDTKETRETNAPGHDYSEELLVDIPVTCTTDGTMAHICSRCGDCKDIVVIPKTGHAYGDWQTKTPATCTEDGVEVRVCANCGDEIPQTLPATGHEEVIDEAVAPQCMVNGKTAGSHCKKCGEVFVKQKVILSTGHTVATDAAVAATCTEDGKTAGSHCTTCGLVIEPQTVIPKLGHKTVIDPMVPSTCTVHGKSEGSHCETCGTVFFAQASLPLKSHEYKVKVVKKTCTTDGYRLHTCVNCGATNKTDFDYALGHQYVYEKQIKETCTTKGRSVQVSCSVCGAIIEPARVIPALGHQWTTTVTPATTKKAGRSLTTCSICGVTKKKGDVTIPKIASVKLSKTKYVCDNKKKVPTVTVTDAAGTVLQKKTDYKLTYDSGRKKVGTYYVTVTFRGKYSGTKALQFKIVLGTPNVTAVKSKSKTVSMTWDTLPGATKYVVYVSDTANGPFKKVAATTNTAVNLKKLSSGTTYVCVRGCAVSTTGETVYSPYSTVTEVTIK